MRTFAYGYFLNDNPFIYCLKQRLFLGLFFSLIRKLFAQEADKSPELLSYFKENMHGYYQ